MSTWYPEADLVIQHPKIYTVAITCDEVKEGKTDFPIIEDGGVDLSQLDLAREAQHQLRDAKERIQRMEHALIIADERLRQIDEGRMTMANQVLLDRALDTICPHLPTEIPF